MKLAAAGELRSSSPAHHIAVFTFNIFVGVGRWLGWFFGGSAALFIDLLLVPSEVNYRDASAVLGYPALGGELRQAALKKFKAHIKFLGDPRMWIGGFRIGLYNATVAALVGKGQQVTP